MALSDGINQIKHLTSLCKVENQFGLKVTRSSLSNQPSTPEDSRVDKVKGNHKVPLNAQYVLQDMS